MPIKDVFLKSVIRVWSISHYSALIISSGYKWMIGKFLLYLHISFCPKLTGHQGGEWIVASITVNPTPKSWQIMFEGIRGSSFYSDMAIDDYSMTVGQCAGGSKYLCRVSVFSQEVNSLVFLCAISSLGNL